MSDFKAKMRQIRFRTLSWILRGPISKGKGGKKKGREWEGKGREEEEGREERGEGEE